MIYQSYFILFTRRLYFTRKCPTLILITLCIGVKRLSSKKFGHYGLFWQKKKKRQSDN